MAVRKVVVSLDEASGEFSVDLTGFNGKGCADVTRMFEKMGTVGKSIKKPEYKQETVNRVCK